MIAESGLTPLEYLMSIVRDEQASQELRLDAAAKAAPYVHPRLSSTEVRATIGQGDVQEMTNEELMRIAAGTGRGDSAEVPDKYAHRSPSKS